MSSRSVNKAILIGNLGDDPELRHTGGGIPVSTFSLATNEVWTNKDGQKQERTEWHRVVAWRGLAEICHQYLKKGSKVYIEGRIQNRSWEDQNGQKRHATEITADNMVMLGHKNDSAGEPATSAELPKQYEDFNPPPESTDDDLPF